MKYLSSKIYRKLITFLAYQNFNLEKYDYDNQKLQPMGVLKNGVPHVLSSWKKLFFNV